MTVISPEIDLGSETQANPVLFELTFEDQDWLDSFGIDPAWQNDTALRQSLNELIAIGSLRPNKSVDQDRRQDIVSARIGFLKFIGLPDDLIDKFQSQCSTIIPLDTFISTQRVMHSLGLDGARMISMFPPAFGLAPESVREKMANFTSFGLDAARLVNKNPGAINLAQELVRENMANFTSLGLDAVRIVNKNARAIGYAPESVHEKMLILRRSAKLLQWQYSAEELVNAYPALIGFNTRKLAILRRIAAYHVDSAERTSSPVKLTDKLIVPLEKYIIALSQLEDDQVLSLRELSKKARVIKLDSSERKKQASEIAPSMGHIGTIYLAYRNKAV